MRYIDELLLTISVDESEMEEKFHYKRYCKGEISCEEYLKEFCMCMDIQYISKNDRDLILKKHGIEITDCPFEDIINIKNLIIEKESKQNKKRLFKMILSKIFG